MLADSGGAFAPFEAREVSDIAGTVSGRGSYRGASRQTPAFTSPLVRIAAISRSLART
jgi:hypothetical protein